MTAIVVENLEKRYGRRRALAGLSLEIGKGEVFGLLGPNGAGKSTLICILAGIVLPSAGRALVAGHDVLREAARVRAAISLVPQEIALYPTLSAIENLRFCGRIRGLRGRMLERSVARALGIADLAERAGDRVNELSAGMQRRLNLAAGLLHCPQVLLLDEPTLGVDLESRRRILETIQRLGESGATVLYCTHQMEEARCLCRRVAVMDQGRLLALDSPADLLRRFEGGFIRLCLPLPPDGLVTRLASLPHVKRAVLEPGPAGQRDTTRALRVEPTAPREAFTEIIALFQNLGLRIPALEYQEPSLENIFLHLTGTASDAEQPIPVGAPGRDSAAR